MKVASLQGRISRRVHEELAEEQRNMLSKENGKWVIHEGSGELATDDGREQVELTGSKRKRVLSWFG